MDRVTLRARSLSLLGLALALALPGSSSGAPPADLLVRSSVRTEHAVDNGSGLTTTQGGSGTVIKKTAGAFYVLSCRHVVEHEGAIGNGRLTLITHDGKRYRASVVAHSAQADLSIMKATGAADVEAVRVADAEEYTPGTRVIKVGYPGGGPRVVLEGEMCNFYNRSVDHPEVISTVATAQSLSGDSGGGLFRAGDRQLVGVIWGGSGDGLRAVRLTDIRTLLRKAAVTPADR